MKKVILITGASSGIGLATAKKLLGEGYVVYASTRKEAARAEVEKLGGMPLVIEMEDEQTMVDAVERVMREQGRIDVLVNNAGYGHYGPIEEVPMEEARKIMQVNMFGLAQLTRLVLPHMRKQKSGLIINTSSIGGKVHTPLGGWYHASKFALEGWSDSLRLETKHLGIKVAIVEPGIINTGFNQEMVGRINDLNSTGGYEDMKKAVLATNSSGDPGSPPEVIAEVMSEIVASENPKTRYHAGKLASLVLFVRSHFSDRFFDQFVMSQVDKMTSKK